MFLKAEEELALSENDIEEEEEEEIITEVSLTDNTFSSLNIRELNTQLEQAVIDENYELAAKIRDEISKRS